jgi:hypothetical protein
MMVNAMFDSMNLVAKEAPLVTERDGVSIVSENTGAREELGEFALSVNPSTCDADVIREFVIIVGDDGLSGAGEAAFPSAGAASESRRQRAFLTGEDVEAMPAWSCPRYRRDGLAIFTTRPDDS